jgi:hypothetical protein
MNKTITMQCLQVIVGWGAKRMDLLGTPMVGDAHPTQKKLGDDGCRITGGCG